MAEMMVAQRRFLQELARWDGVASKEDLKPTSFINGSGRSICRSRGWAIFDGHYWRITPAGRAALQSAQESSK